MTPGRRRKIEREKGSQPVAWSRTEGVDWRTSDGRSHTSILVYCFLDLTQMSTDMLLYDGIVPAICVARSEALPLFLAALLATGMLRKLRTIKSPNQGYIKGDKTRRAIGICTANQSIQ
jgi:hypothetical protein